MTRLPKPPNPPKHLAKAGREHWRAVASRFVLHDHDLAVLEAACRELDRAVAFRAEVESRGVIIQDRFGVPRENPAASGERQALDLFRKLNRELGLNFEPSDSRPPPAKGNR